MPNLGVVTNRHYLPDGPNLRTADQSPNAPSCSKVQTSNHQEHLQVLHSNPTMQPGGGGVLTQSNHFLLHPSSNPPPPPSPVAPTVCRLDHHATGSTTTTTPNLILPDPSMQLPAGQASACSTSHVPRAQYRYTAIPSDTSRPHPPLRVHVSCYAQQRCCPTHVARCSRSMCFVLPNSEPNHQSPRKGASRCTPSHSCNLRAAPCLHAGRLAHELGHNGGAAPG